MTAMCEGGLAVNPINLLTPRARLPGRGMGFEGPMRERGKESSARDSLTRLLEFASSWQQIQQHGEAVPQTLRALGREAEEALSQGVWGMAVSKKSMPRGLRPRGLWKTWEQGAGPVRSAGAH